MGDYPDYTDIMRLIGSDVMVPIDIQAAYLMMPVDIQAQWVTLDINIKAKEVTLTIEIEAQTVSIFLQADWATLEGNSKYKGLLAPEVAVGGHAEDEYEVPGTKTVYITQASLKASAHLE
ncbi:unnamed protein product, partial [marine sediment metagenome]